MSLCLCIVWRCSSSLLQVSGPRSLREQHLLFLCTNILCYALNEITTSCLVPGAADPVDCVLPKNTDFVADIASAPQYLVFPMYLLRISYLDNVFTPSAPSSLQFLRCLCPHTPSQIHGFLFFNYTCDTHIFAYTSTHPSPTLLCVYRFINATQ